MITPAIIANEDDASTLNNQETTVAPVTTANEEDITWTGGTIEMLASLQIK